MAALPMQDSIAEASQISVSYKQLVAKFGDGYEQVVANGINNKVKTWDITYENLFHTDYDTIMNFLDTLSAGATFTATPRGEASQTWRLIADSIRVGHTHVNHAASSAQFNQVLRTIQFQARTVVA